MLLCLTRTSMPRLLRLCYCTGGSNMPKLFFQASLNVQVCSVRQEKQKIRFLCDSIGPKEHETPLQSNTRLLIPSIQGHSAFLPSCFRHNNSNWCLGVPHKRPPKCVLKAWQTSAPLPKLWSFIARFARMRNPRTIRGGSST